MTAAPEQTSIPGTEAPRDVEIDEALTAWVRAKADQKDASESTKLKHSVLLQRLANKGLEKYAYVDHEGKKRTLFIEREPKAKTKAGARDATKPKSAKQIAKEERAAEKREKREERIAEAKDAAALQGVPYTPPDIGHSDPFGKTRRALEDAAT